MSKPVKKNLSIESYLAHILETAHETGDKLVVEWTKDLVTDICNEYGLCSTCHAKTESALFDGYMVTACACKEKITKYA